MLLVVALSLILLSVAYFLVITFVDLYPFNNVRNATRAEQRTEALINAPIMTLPAVLLGLAAATGLPALGYPAAVLELLIALGGLLLWWTPYLVGVSMPWATAGTGVSWPQLHARTYAHTVIVLPRIGERPRPNLEHMLLHAILLAATVTTFAAVGSL